MKITVLGCGLRTPLLIHGLAHSDLGVTELALYDVASSQAEMMAAMGRVIAADQRFRITPYLAIAPAIEGADFVISSIRVGGIGSRARDERISVNHGFAGQETTGPAGFAMALRTVPVSIDHARMVDRLAPKAWIVNFTNPAGLITQAIATHATSRVVGICDTPAELFHRIAGVLGRSVTELECDYLGLNHLGWVHRVRTVHDNRDLTIRLFDCDLRALYPAPLFDPDLLREMRLLPTEYVYFYYSQRDAYQNQLVAGATRGEELLAMNTSLLDDLQRQIADGEPEQAVQTYVRYLNRRNASYLQLEGAGRSAFATADPDWDPFAGETGYHRIAVEALRALSGRRPGRVVLDVPARGSVAELAPDDVVEIPCHVDPNGATPLPVGPLPEPIRGLVLAVKAYERATIRAAIDRSPEAAAFALFLNPIVSDWRRASALVQAFAEADPEHLGDFGRSRATDYRGA